MKIGEKFTFNSNGKKRKALYLSKENEKIHCVICDEKMAGVNVEIHETQIIHENQTIMKF